MRVQNKTLEGAVLDNDRSLFRRGVACQLGRCAENGVNERAAQSEDVPCSESVGAENRFEGRTDLTQTLTLGLENGKVGNFGVNFSFLRTLHPQVEGHGELRTRHCKLKVGTEKNAGSTETKHARHTRAQSKTCMHPIIEYRVGVV